MTDVMLDLETLGLRPGSVVLSIGAVAFDRVTGEIKDKFYQQLAIPQQLAVGAVIDEGTEKWWSDQPLAAWENATKNAKDPVVVLNEFTQWFYKTNSKTVWANGAAFDPPVLSELFALFSLKNPWHYRAPRDTRTLFDLCGNQIGDFKTVNVLEHDALEDALWQTAECVEAFAQLRNDTEMAARYLTLST